MRLGTKIFFYITVFFSVAFLFSGYILLSYFYEVAMDREIASAVERYQYNKFVLQANLITRGKGWFEDAVAGSYDLGGMASDMNDTVAFYSLEGEKLYSAFPSEVEFEELFADITQNQVDYRFSKIRGRTYLLTAGIVAHGDSGICLVTGGDVEKVIEQQEQIIRKFGVVYGVAVGIGMVLIFGMSVFLTKPIKSLTAATQKIADGNYRERVADAGRDEVGQLARNFNKMAIAVEEKVQELSDSARQKEDFVANFAHELKTPLTSVIGYADRIYQKELSREDQKQAAWHIWNEGMRLEALSLKLMDLTNLNHEEFVLEEVRTGTLFQELAADMEYLMEHHGISLAWEIEEACIRVEYDLFKTLMLNLVDNAVKAGARHIWITGAIEKGFEGIRKHKPKEREIDIGKSVPGQRRYRIQVRDDGSGIPEQEIRRITEAFYMVDKSRARKQHGAGLGLALSEKIAQIHGSALRFESDGKSGTTVSMEMDIEE